jgi:chitin disaccharide deacetylase
VKSWKHALSSFQLPVSSFQLSVSSCQETRRLQVIFNADDFGRSTEINRAVLRAHREGVLTSASLMVTGDAAEEAVALARETPTLAVWLHLALSGARPAQPAGEIPHLVGRDGRFPANPARVWIRVIFSAAARAEMTCEVRAQFKRFVATGLPLDHVDAHQHLHMHPAVFRTLLPLAEQHGAGGVRLPRDDFRLAVRYDRRDAAVKAVWAAVFGILCRRFARELAAAQGLAVTDRVYGLMQTGRMEEAYVLQVLAREPSTSPAPPVILSGSIPTASRRRRLSEESRIELYFHPTLASKAEPLGPNRGDLATLLSPAVRQAVEQGGWTRTTYSALREAG